MGKVKKGAMKKLRMLCVAAAMMALAWRPVPALAGGQSEQASRSQWIDMEKGPGAARWVDEDGVISEAAGVKPGEDTRQEDRGPKPVGGYVERGPGQAVRETSAGEEGQPPRETGGEEAASTQNGTAQGGSAGAGGQGGSAGEAGQGISAGDGSQGGSAGEVGQGLSADEGSQGGQEASGRTIAPDRPMVALTFDDGPFAPVGNQIMDCMAQYGGKATFFVVGERCASYQALMQRMVAEGHEIGNHTYNHKYLNLLDAGQIQYQVNKGSEAIQAACGVAPALVRLPGGNKNATVVANVHAPIIMWSIDTRDWKTRDTKSTVDKVLGNVRDGDIVLMHELYTATGNAAVQIIPALTARGYQLVTVSELARYRGGLQAGQIYYAMRP